MESIPLHSYDLIDELDRLYPERVFDAAANREEFLMQQGERRLVLHLKRVREMELEDQRSPAGSLV